MTQTITSSDCFLKICVRNNIRVILLDLRGTLFKAPRGENIARAAAAIGFNNREITNIDKRVPSEVINAYRNEIRVSDWTLVSVLKFAELAKKSGIVISLPQCEQIYQIIRKEYFDQSVPLVTDARLANFVGMLSAIGVNTTIAADGLSSFEQATFRRIFPETGTLGIDVIASDTFGNNKLVPDFYDRCAKAHQTVPERCLVIGDRIDKDILSGSRAGCRTLLVGDSGGRMTAEENSPDWKTDCFEQITPNRPRQSDGVLFGRFQPFHREHLRFVRHAAAYCTRLTIGVTNPFLDGAEPNTNNRALREKNPLPFWFRKRWILSVLEADGFNLDRFSVIPCPLKVDRLAQIFEPNTPAYVTSVEDWSEEKSSIIAQAGLKICNISIGPKTISGTEIRNLICARDSRWHSLICTVSDDSLLNELETRILTTALNSKNTSATDAQ